MGNKKLKTMLHPPLQFDILNIESEKKELSGRGRARGRALCVLRQEILAESILAGTTVGAMGVRVSSTSKKAKAKEKAKGKSNRAGKKAATTTTTTTTTTTSSSTSSSSSSSSAKDKQPVDLAEVRKEISSIVGTNAAALTRAVMGEGLKGQLAPVKYLFEATGLYPATEISETKPDKESLAHTLMRNLKLPESPIVNEDDNEDDEDADSSNSSPAAAGAGQTNQPSGADSGTSADEKCSQGEEGTTAEKAGDSVVE
jgi:hypothetical protein